MERVMQLLDDLEDFVCAVALAAGRILLALRTLVLLVVSIVFQTGALLLALAQPPLGMAIAAILSVALLYRTVVGQHPRIPA